QVVVDLLDVLTVVALAVGQAEQALLQDRVVAVPQCQRQAEALLVVADAGDAVLAPAVGAAAGVVMGEVPPGVAVGAVVLAHGAPLPLAQVRAPFLPRLAAEAVLFKTPLLLVHRKFVRGHALHLGSESAVGHGSCFRSDRVFGCSSARKVTTARWAC